MTEERLSYLFLNYLENTCSHQEMEEFFAFIKQAKTDAQLRGLIKKVYEGIKQSHPFPSYIDETGNLVFAGPGGDFVTPPVQKNNRIKLVAIAASVLIVAGVMLFRIQMVDNSDLAAVKTLSKKFTEREEQKYLLLPDSTEVWLNSASSLQVPEKFQPGKREVYLTGEAYFDVKHADKIPFLIHTGNITTTVLGTAFNIRAYNDQSEFTVAVTRGKVKVSREDTLLAVLTKGEAVKISNTTEQVTEKDVAVENIAVWKDGTLVYDDAPLEDIVKDLQNVFNTDIKIGDSSVARLSVTTSFRRDMGAEKALNVLARLLNKQVVDQNGTLIIK